jgi:hypothetical protein
MVLLNTEILNNFAQGLNFICPDNEGKKYTFYPTTGHQLQKKKSSNYFVLFLIVVLPCIFDKFKTSRPTNALFIKT